MHLKGRVWSGKRALEVGLVDALGGLSRAVAIAKQQLKIPDSENVALIELSREQMSPLMLLSGGASATSAADIIKVLVLPQTHCAGSDCKGAPAIRSAGLLGFCWQRKP